MDSARTPVPPDESIPSMPRQDGLDAIDSSADEDNSDEFISTNSTDSDTTKDPILFSQKHLSNLIRGLCLYKKKTKLHGQLFKTHTSTLNLLV